MEAVASVWGSQVVLTSDICIGLPGIDGLMEIGMVLIDFWAEAITMPR